MEKIIDTLLNDATVGFERVYAETMDMRAEQFENTQKLLSELKNTLTDKQKTLFNAWKKAESRLQTEEMESVYKRGLKVGMQLVFEVYNFKF